MHFFFLNKVYSNEILLLIKNRYTFYFKQNAYKSIIYSRFKIFGTFSLNKIYSNKTWL